MSDKRKMSRRQFGGLAAGAMAAPLLARDTTGSSRPAGPERPKGGAGSKPGLNILFVFTDQERYVRKWPAGLDLPTHERLQRTGVTFENHYTSAIMCTPSRSVLLTGLQTPDNRMFDNADVPWQQSLSTKVPTIGHMLRQAGYYTAPKVDWVVDRADL